jgi:septal ring factor EnvC (AmiA/AmiB activator)
MARLIQSEASLVENQSSFLSHLTDHHQRVERIERDLARIARDVDQIKAVLVRHEQMLNDLPEAIRQKIGFTSAPGSPAPPSS